jgi:hypothetical protein
MMFCNSQCTNMMRPPERATRAVRKCMRLTILLFALVAMSAMAHAQSPESASTEFGNCRPHKPEEGPWKCEREALHRPCVGGKQPPDPVWQTSQSESDAIRILRIKYLQYNDLPLFVDWLRCQGFSVEATIREEGQPSHLSVDFNRRTIQPFPLQFYKRWFSLGQIQWFAIQFDEQGNIKSAWVNDTQ